MELSIFRKLFLTLVIVSFLTGNSLGMTQVKDWINQVKPGTFETEDVSTDSKADGPKAFTEGDVKVLTALKEREEILRRKEAIHQQRANELKTLAQQIEQKLDQMRKLAAEIEGNRKNRMELDEKDISRMVKYYETMDPENTATFFNNMDRLTAMHIIMRMNPRKASAVLQRLDPKVAVEITERVTRFKMNKSEIEPGQNP